LRTSEGQKRTDVYEEGPLRDVTGATIRPGGLILTDRAIDFCGFAAGAQILDVGCGAGATVEHLLNRYGFATRGVDISRKLIAEGLDRNPALSLVEAAAEALPFAGETQDGILCECVLSLLGEPPRALAEFHRVLRSGGYLILSDMYSKEVSVAALSDSDLRGLVARRQVETWLSKSGFTILLWEDHTPFLRELAARLILAQGSLEGFCCAPKGTGQRPGYYLLVAGKV
jgi:arsenite methyltransferase